MAAATATTGAMLTVAVVVAVIASVGVVRMIVTVVSEREAHQRGWHVVALDGDEGIAVVSRVIPTPVAAEPVVVVRVEDLVVLANHDRDPGLNDGHLRTLGQRDVDLCVAAAKRERRNERQTDRDE